MDDREPPQTWPALVARRAATCGDAVALRRKTLGEWRSDTWRQLDADVTRLGNAFVARGMSREDALLVDGDLGPEALTLVLAVQRLGGTVVWIDRGSAAEVPAGVRFAVAGRAGGDLEPLSATGSTRIAIDALETERVGERSTSYSSLLAHGDDPGASAAWTVAADDEALRIPAIADDGQLTHRELIAEGRALLASHRIGSDDRALSPAGLDPMAAAVVFAAWLVGGFSMHFAETSDTRADDRREVAPSILFESASAYADLHRHVLDALPSAGTLERGLVDWGLDRRRRGLLGRAIADRLVRRPLRRILGLSKVEVALVVGGRLEGATLAFCGALGLAPAGDPIDVGGDTPSLSTVAPRRALEPIGSPGGETS